MKKLPNYYVKDIFSIPLEFFINKNIKYVLSDLDNTLDAFDVYEPSDRVFNLKKKLNENGIELIIVSNNKGHRVNTYSNNLNVKYLSSAMKPFAHKLLNYLKENNIKLDECVLIGDQLLTDCKCGVNAKILTILTDPISKKDQWTTHFNRLIDKPLRKRLKKKKLLNYMEEKDYGKKN